MDKLKSILTLVAVIVGSLAVLAGIGLIYSLLSYLLLLGVICLGAIIAFRLLRGSKPRQLPGDSHRELKKIERILDEYKR